MPSSANILVLDTNVILHDSQCLDSFEKDDIVLPIAVLEELDHFKKGNEMINFHARNFVRILDRIIGERSFNSGIRLAPDRGTFSIALDREFDPEFARSFSSSTPDHRILYTAYRLQREHPDRRVTLVTKDVNLRMKAKAIGINTQDYISDRVKDLSQLYKGSRLVEGVDDSLIDNLYQAPFALPADRFAFDPPPIANEYFILRNGRKSVLAVFDHETNMIRRVDKKPAYGIMPRNAEQTFALDALTREVPLVTIGGKAGTGKTLLALAAALERRKNYRQIFLARPVVPLSNRDLGYLPGDVQSKLDPYMKPLYDNLSVIQHQFPESDAKYKRITEMLAEDKLIISPLAYIRGRSLQNIYFIVDEAQNLTPHEVKTIITRCGEGTKVVFTGDIFQIDHPYLDSESNGLSYLIDRMKGQKLFAHVTLEKGERSELAELAADIL
ncbi:MAG: PhoH family protein [Chlorobi bacterium]|nr:PhoH family protein [Chlorobiota bacterium]